MNLIILLKKEEAEYLHRVLLNESRKIVREGTKAESDFEAAFMLNEFSLNGSILTKLGFDECAPIREAKV